MTNPFHRDAILAGARAAALDEHGNRRVAGRSPAAVQRHIILMSAELVRRFGAPTAVTRVAARELHNVHGFTLSKLQRPWGELTGDIIRAAMANAQEGRR